MNPMRVVRGLAGTVRSHREVGDLGPLSALFADRRYALLWVPVRLWLGVLWLQYAFIKLTDPAWMGSGETMKGYLLNATATAGQDWYRAFMQALLDSGAYVYMAKVVAFGELAVGLGILFGGLTGLAALNGLFMNINYLLSGSMGPDPQMVVAGGVLAIAWKTAGYYGADYALLPLLAAAREKLTARLAPLFAKRAAAAGLLAVRSVSVASVSAVALVAWLYAGPLFAPAAPVAVAEGPVAVEMTAAAFRANDIAVRPGATVTWTNTSAVAHTVTSGAQPKADGRFDSGLLKAGATYQQTFNTPGTYAYFCAYHAGMVGTVTVVANAN